MTLNEFFEGAYYKQLGPNFRAAPVVGQFCRVVVPFVTDPPRIMEVERADPTSHRVFQFNARSMRPTDFSAHNKLPLKLLNLRSTEELVAYRSKFRPGIVVGTKKTIDPVAHSALGKAIEHLHDDSVLVVPVYGVESPDHPGGIPPLVMARIEALVYDQFFPVFSGPRLEAGVARLDRILAARPKPLAFEPLQLALSDAAFGVLKQMLHELLGADPDPNLTALRQLLAEGAT